MDLLLRFYKEEGLREAVKAFQYDMLGEVAKELAFEGKSTAGITEAKQALDKTFDKLDEMYGTIVTEKPESSR